MARLILLLATSLANAARPAGHDGMPHARRLKAEWPGEATWQSRAIFAERRSPTTDMISFSPRTWPITRHPSNEDLYKLTVLQRACRLSNADYHACYTSSFSATPFTYADSNTEDKKFDLFRAAREFIHVNHGIEAYSTAGEACNDGAAFKDANFLGWGSQSFNVQDATNPAGCLWESVDKRYMKPVGFKQIGPDDTPYDYTFEVCTFGGACETNDFDCINAYTVVALSDPAVTDTQTLLRYSLGNPGTVWSSYYPRQLPKWGSGTVNYIYDIPEGGPYFPCPAEPNGKQTPCVEGGSGSDTYSYSYSDDGFSYAGRQLGEKNKEDMAGMEGIVGEGGKNGSLGRRLSEATLCLTASQSTCPYMNDGSCDDGGPDSKYSDCDYGSDCADCGSRTAKSLSYSYDGMPEPTTQLDPEVGPVPGSRGSQRLFRKSPFEDLVVTVSKLDIQLINRNEWDHFVATFRYEVEWTSRYAVHPCTISLYDVGEGVSRRGKWIDGSSWWRPAPKGINAESTVAELDPSLQVLHAPGVPVEEPCVLQDDGEPSCPWPKQLFLKDKVKVTVGYASKWDLAKFPFDHQTLSGSISLVDNVAYAQDRKRVSLNFTSPPEEYKVPTARLEMLYPGSAWKATSVDLRQSPTNPVAIEFTINVQRTAMAPLFKALIPSICNALFAILASRCSANVRLKLLALSMIAATSMLQPSRLGLPEGVESVPFVMALVILHMAVVALMLLITAFLLSVGHSAEQTGNAFRKAKRGGFHSEWAPAFEAKNEIAAQLGIPRPSEPAMTSTQVLVNRFRPKKAMQMALNRIAPEKNEPISYTMPDAGLEAGQATSTIENTEVNPLSPSSPTRGKPADEPLTLLTKAVIVLPSLIHHAVQSTLPAPTHPEGFGKSNYAPDWTTERERKLKALNKKVDEILYYSIPPTYAFFWMILVIAYFAV